jgi:S1-C subfamily serine protease
MKKLLSYIGLGVIIFVVGALGGLLADYVIFSKVITHPIWSQHPIIKAFDNRVKVIKNTEKIIVENNESIADIASRASTSVVYVEAQDVQGVISGNGVIIGSDGVIATTIDIDPTNVNDIIVKLSDHSVHTVQSHYTDAYSGITFLKIDKQDLATVPFANSDDARSGKRLVGIMQSPVENDVFFASVGFLGHAHDFSTASPTSDHLQGVLFLDLSPQATSIGVGAPVLDYQGNMVGIIDHKRRSDVLENIVNDSVFAIASNDVHRAFEDFLNIQNTQKESARVLLGVNYEMISGIDVQREKLDISSGARILAPTTYEERVIFRQTRAAQVGILENDIVIMVNNTVVDTQQNLSRLMHDAGESDIMLKVMRGDQLLTIDIPQES